MSAPTCAKCGADSARAGLLYQSRDRSWYQCVDGTACDLRAELRDVTAERDALIRERDAAREVIREEARRLECYDADLWGDTVRRLRGAL